MNDTNFEGQQSGERILYTIKYPDITLYLAIIRVALLALFFLFVLFLIASVVTPAAVLLRVMGIFVSLAVLIIGIWWNLTVHNKSKTYITDRRIIRFEVISPFFQAKRALFWNEALKAKAFAPGMWYRMLNIGTVMVEPHLAEHENVIINNVYYYNDIANYIDKILFIFKNKPEEVEQLKPFVPKPRGQRY